MGSTISRTMKTAIIRPMAVQGPIRGVVMLIARLLVCAVTAEGGPWGRRKRNFWSMSFLKRHNILWCHARGAFEPHFSKGEGCAKIYIQPVARASAEHKVRASMLLYRTLAHF